MRYAVDQLWEETAYLAYYLHWPIEDILGLPHAVRHRMITEVGKIHSQLGVGPGAEEALVG